MTEQIISQSDLFRGELVDKPRQCLYAPDGKMICPHCGIHNDEDDCDVCGAEPDALFCNQCNREFYV